MYYKHVDVSTEREGVREGVTEWRREGSDAGLFAKLESLVPFDNVRRWKSQFLSPSPSSPPISSDFLMERTSCGFFLCFRY
jgi:hypothetical protein